MILDAINRQIEEITSLSVDKRKKLLLWLSKQNAEMQAIVFKDQKNEYFKINSKHHNVASEIIGICRNFKKRRKSNETKRFYNI